MTHPTDLELAAWVDEPGTVATGVARHAEGCDACRERTREIAAARVALALDPPMPSAAEFAAQREQILIAIGAERPARGVVVRRLAWLAPLAAAAAIAAVVLMGRTGGPGEPTTADAGPEAATTAEGARTPLPLVADAREAAELAATAIVPDSGAVVVPSEAIDADALEAALSAAEPLAPPSSIEASMTAQSRFAELTEEDQSAVLLELASADFDL